MFVFEAFDGITYNKLMNSEKKKCPLPHTQTYISLKKWISVDLTENFIFCSFIHSV